VGRLVVKTDPPAERILGDSRLLGPEVEGCLRFRMIGALDPRWRFTVVPYLFWASPGAEEYIDSRYHVREAGALGSNRAGSRGRQGRDASK